MKTSNIKCSQYVDDKMSFQANNIFSENHGEKYFVFSYGHHWILYAYVDGIWYENKDRYSVSTSKHRSQARPNAQTTLISKTDIHKLY